MQHNRCRPKSCRRGAPACAPAAGASPRPTMAGQKSSALRGTRCPHRAANVASTTAAGGACHSTAAGALPPKAGRHNAKRRIKSPRGSRGPQPPCGFLVTFVPLQKSPVGDILTSPPRVRSAPPLKRGGFCGAQQAPALRRSNTIAASQNPAGGAHLCVRPQNRRLTLGGPAGCPAPTGVIACT